MTNAPPLSPLKQMFQSIQTAQSAQPYPCRDTRLTRLDKLIAFLTDHEQRLIKAMQADFTHRSREECLSLDLGTSMSQARQARRHLKRWMRPRHVATPLAFWPARARIHPQPRGVVGIMAPWNFPVYLAIAPLAGALAAGNRVMIKPSEHAPATSTALADGLAQYFEADEIQVVLGGADVAAQFSALPFDHLLFTGSTEIGRKVAAAAAQNLTPVTLELGGKSPAIVMPSADLNRAARRIAWGRALSAGQVCVAPDYALVSRDLVETFAAKIEKAWQRFYPQGAASPDYCGIISEPHRARLDAMLDEVRTKGVKVTQLTQTDLPQGQRKFAPALVVDPPRDSAIMRQEIFGPILPIIPYDTPQEALDFVAQRDHPLALYVFAENKHEQDLWLTQSQSGGITINDTVIQVAVDTLPFGGVGASGYGAYHGKTGFETFSHMKPVMRQAKWNAMALTEAPSTRRKSRILKIARRLM